jgi:hypothetical protein
VPKKPDADKIRAFLSNLQAESWLGTQRRAWPHHAYHYTDVQNAARILANNQLMSRNRCEEEGLLCTDAASSAVLSGSPWAHQYARLYFRPRTHVQWHCEGHTTRETRSSSFPDAHCPVPVFLLFDLEELLTDQECCFSDGNLARRAHTIGTTHEFLEGLEFRDIYRDAALPEDRQRADEIKFAMHAEVLFEEALNLSHLKHIVCRSGAERDTLLTFLGETEEKWRDKIRLEDAGERLFFRMWAYIKSVRLVNGRLVVQGEDDRHQTFNILIRVFSPDHDEYQTRVVQRLSEDFAVDLPWSPDKAAVRIDLNGSLAFRAVLSSRELF